MAQTKIKAGLFEGIIGNGTDGYFLMSNGDGTMTWSSIIINPTISSIAYPGSVTAADPAGGETITVTGTGFKTGATVTIGGTAAPAVSYVSATQITFTTPAKAAGDYDIVVTNTDTGSATYINGISYNGIPTWTTAAGSLGTFASDTTISTITLQATEPDAGTITFSITNGALPTGLSLTGANIDGTTTLETADTLYTFTVTATDDESQATPRTFTITVTKQFIGTENFTINTYTGNGSTQSIEGKIGTAAQFDGSSSVINLGSSAPFGDNDDIKAISGWIKTNGTTDNNIHNAWLYSVSSADTYDWFYVAYRPTQNIIQVYRRNGASDYAQTDATITPDTDWHHVLVQLTSTEVEIYLDGTKLTTTNTNSGTGSNTSWIDYPGYSGTVYSQIGRSRQNTPKYYDGKIDQVRFFNRALSSDEVTTLYGEPSNPSTVSKTDIFDDGSGIALYEFEEGAKDTGGVTGYIGAAGVFNGSSSYIDTSVSVLPADNYTVSMWVYHNSLKDGCALYTQYRGTVTGRHIVNSNANGSIQINTTSTNSLSSITATPFTTNTWQHLVVTKSSTAGYVVYIDGSSIGSWSNTDNIITDQSTQFGGDTEWSGDHWLNGKLDQVRIFDKALSSSEVTTLYGETSASATKSTTDIFDDGSGVALYELEGNSLDTGGATGRTSGTEAAVFTNADNSNFNLGNTTVVNNSFGVSFWVKMNKISQSEAVYLCSFMYGSNTSLYMDTNNVLQVSNGGYSRDESFSTTHTFAADTWYHIVYTGQIAGDSTLRCYVNGTQVGSRGWITGHNYTLTSGNRIGSYNNGDNSIDGNIADFRIYKSTYLSASDVTDLYSGTPPTTGLTEFYSFNGNDTDAQGNRTLTASNVIYAYDGTATNVSYAYDGTPTNVSFVGTSFQPDLVWIKNRNNSTNSTHDHSLFDSIRGNYRVRSNSTGTENDYSSHFGGIDANGFTVTSGLALNDTSGTYVAWCWKAGGAAVSNTNGTITSQVSANQDAGFSIVKYTGNGTSSQNIGHGLSSAPEMIIIKNLTTAQNWVVYNTVTNLGNSDIDYGYLSLNYAFNYSGDSGVSNPTSTVFNIGTSTFDGSNNDDFIAYCFHSVDGYQKVGSYSGTGASGNAVTTGFRPRFVMVKRTDSAGNWVIKDSQRDSTNPNSANLYPNLNNAENTVTTLDMDFDDNGFTLDGTSGDVNGSSATYIYLAIA